MSANLYVIEDYENETAFRPKKTNPIQTQSMLGMAAMKHARKPLSLRYSPFAYGHRESIMLNSRNNFIIERVFRRLAMKKVSVFSPKRIIVIVTVLTIGLFPATSSIQSKESRSVLRKESPGLQAGTAKVDITPKKPVKMAGYSSRKGLSKNVPKECLSLLHQ